MGRFNYYAVVNGKDGFTGLTTSWEECSKYVKNIEGVRYKGFSQQEDAEAWIKRTQERIGSETVNIPDYLSKKETAPSKRPVRKMSSITGALIIDKIKELQNELNEMNEKFAVLLELSEEVYDLAKEGTEDDDKEEPDDNDLPFK